MGRRRDAVGRFTLRCGGSRPIGERPRLFVSIEGAEATDLRAGGDLEAAPPRVEVRMLQADAQSVRFVAPALPGAYRLFITLGDSKGKAATANLPFLVR